MATWTKVVVESSAGNIAQKAATAGTADVIASQGQLATLDTIDTGNINSSAIETAKINNSAVTNAKIADNAVSEAKLYSQNSASSGQVLSFSGSDAFTWVDQTSQVSVDAGISSSSSNPVENHVVYDQLALKENVISASNRVGVTDIGTGVVDQNEFNFLNGVTSAIQTQFGTKVSTSGNETIAGNKTFSGDTTVANLTVTGTTTTVNTEEINLADNIIKLNSNATGTPSESQDVGIEVDRGSASDARLVWDESEDRWKVYIMNVPTQAFLQTVAVSSSATAPTANLDGVGMMYMADGVPYIRTV